MEYTERASLVMRQIDENGSVTINDVRDAQNISRVHAREILERMFWTGLIEKSVRDNGTPFGLAEYRRSPVAKWWIQ